MTADAKAVLAGGIAIISARPDASDSAGFTTGTILIADALITALPESVVLAFLLVAVAVICARPDNVADADFTGFVAVTVALADSVALAFLFNAVAVTLALADKTAAVIRALYAAAVI
jgi:hypothetical protein